MRDSFASIDTADDIEAVRRKLGVDKLAIYGVSYGTWVAQQYARRYPEHVERLILDSVVSPAPTVGRAHHPGCCRGSCATCAPGARAPASPATPSPT